MKIKKIKKQGTKYEIILENNDKIKTYDEIILENNILYKKDLNTELLNKIIEQNEYYEVYYKIIKNIKQKLKSEAEIKKQIKKYNVDEEKLIKQLKENNIINDEIYAKSYIHDKILLSQDGPKKIKQELQKQNIDINIIEEEINKIDKEQIKEKLEKLIIKKITLNTKYPTSILKTKLLNYFINLGYEKNEIIYLIEKNKTKNKINNKESIEKDYKKLYEKYKNKYDEYKLKQTIKQKLYQKGYSIEEINNFI